MDPLWFWDFFDGSQSKEIYIWFFLVLQFSTKYLMDLLGLSSVMCSKISKDCCGAEGVLNLENILIVDSVQWICCEDGNTSVPFTLMKWVFHQRQMIKKVCTEPIPMRPTHTNMRNWGKEHQDLGFRIKLIWEHCQPLLFFLLVLSLSVRPSDTFLDPSSFSLLFPTTNLFLAVPLASVFLKLNAIDLSGQVMHC